LLVIDFNWGNLPNINIFFSGYAERSSHLNDREKQDIRATYISENPVSSHNLVSESQNVVISCD
jgi:hypothetical protein